MTNKEAIDILRNAAWLGTDAEREQIEEAVEMAVNALTAQPETHDKRTETHACDYISRQDAIDAVESMLRRKFGIGGDLAEITLAELPSEQPERRCVNCGRTVNNGGWYEDGRTRCPIEEHYALPKDGYCHLWEKRKDWEDDYVKRAEEGEK